jgi:hypothetical protein
MYSSNNNRPTNRATKTATTMYYTPTQLLEFEEQGRRVSIVMWSFSECAGSAYYRFVQGVREPIGDMIAVSFYYPRKVVVLVLLLFILWTFWSRCSGRFGYGWLVCVLCQGHYGS